MHVTGMLPTVHLSIEACPCVLMMMRDAGDSLAGAARRVVSSYGVGGMYRGIVRYPASPTFPQPKY